MAEPTYTGSDNVPFLKDGTYYVPVDGASDPLPFLAWSDLHEEE